MSEYNFKTTCPRCKQDTFSPVDESCPCEDSPENADKLADGSLSDAAYCWASSCGRVTLYLGDCLEILPTLEVVDSVIADPPYGTTACEWDSVIPMFDMWEHLKNAVKPNASIIMTASQPFTSVLIAGNVKCFKHEWIWQKNRGSNFGAAKFQPLKEHESVVVFSGTGERVNYYPIKETRKGGGLDRVSYAFNGSNTGKREAYSGFKDERKGHREGELRYPSSIQKHNTEVGLHPTQKPVSLMRYLVETYTQPGGVVLDFTMGSGTTGIACIRTGRKFIGIEKDPEHYATALNRIQTELAQGDLFL